LKITLIEVVKKAVVKPHGVGGWGDDPEINLKFFIYDSNIDIFTSYFYEK